MTQVVQLRRVASLDAGQSPPSDEVSDIADGLPFLQGNAEFGKTYPSPKYQCNTASKTCRQGDLLVSVRAPVGATNFADRKYGIGRGLAAIRTSDDNRYLRYSFLTSRQPLLAYAAGSTFEAVTGDHLRELPLHWAPLETQRKIADFLDEEVTCIDEIIRLREDQVDGLERRVEVAADQALIARGWHEPATLEVEAVHPLPPGWRVARLSQVLRQLTNGYVGATRDILVDEGIRYIQSLHIKAGAIDFDRRHFFVTPEWHAARPRIQLREGDVLIVQTGDIGRVAVVRPGFGEASCHALQIARVHAEIVSGPYLGTFLRSSFGYHSLLSRATGALHPHLEGGIRSVPIVIPPAAVQAEIVAEVENVRRETHLVQQEMRAQIELLQERKRSLITAAVTGEFDVTTASGRGVA